MPMKTLFNTLKPVFSDKVKTIFSDRNSSQELQFAIESEREGNKESKVIHSNGKMLRLVRVS